jgi:hypothetical protein
MLSRVRIVELLKEIDKKLLNEGIKGEIYLLGGAVMCLCFNARESTKDIDAIFLPKSKIRNIAEVIAVDNGLPKDWLNDAVKGFLSKDAEYNSFGEFNALKVFVAKAEYILAMKSLAMRIGEEFHDEDDVRFLLRYLNITSFNQAISIITNYYPLEMFPQKTLYVLEELLEC